MLHFPHGLLHEYKRPFLQNLGVKFCAILHLNNLCPEIPDAMQSLESPSRIHILYQFSAAL